GRRPGTVRRARRGLRRPIGRGRDRPGAGPPAAPPREHALAVAPTAARTPGGILHAVRLPALAPGRKSRARRRAHAGGPDDRAAGGGIAGAVRRAAHRLRPVRGRGLLLPPLAPWANPLPPQG